jgi:hypothetical protein
MKKLILFLITSTILVSCVTQQKGYNYSKHRKSGNQMNRSTQRVNKHNYNQLHHKCSPKKHRR